MSRYLLDTNILVFLVSGDGESLSNETKYILEDYNFQIYTSSVCIMELVQLFNIGKMKTKKYKTAVEIINAVETIFDIKILSYSKLQLNTLANLKIANNHNDPFDHSIIAHAISEKMTLVSSDKKFKEYTSQNLRFAFNKR